MPITTSQLPLRLPARLPGLSNLLPSRPIGTRSIVRNRSPASLFKETDKDKGTRAPTYLASLKTTLLPNGCNAISVDLARPLTTLGIFFTFGSSHESLQHAGSSTALECYWQELTRSWRYKDRVSLTCSSDMLSLNCSFLRDYEDTAFMDSLTEMLSSFFSVRNEAIWPRVQTRRDHALKELLHGSPQDLFSELTTHAAFKNTPVASTRFLHQSSSGLLNSGKRNINTLPSFTKTPTQQTVREFLQCNLLHSEMFVVASDCEHSDLVSLAKRLQNVCGKSVHVCKETGKETQQSRLKSQITLIEQMPSPKDTAFASILFDTTDITHKQNGSPAPITPESLTPYFLGTLLGGGDSFSSGGPGKGILSRLHTRVLPLYGVESCASFILGFRCGKSSSLGVTMETSSEAIWDCLDRCEEEVDKLACKGVSKSELNRVRKQLRFNLWNSLERPEVLVEEIGRQASRVGVSKLPQEWSPEIVDDSIRRITREVVLQAAQNLAAAPEAVVVMANKRTLGRCNAFYKSRTPQT